MAGSSIPIGSVSADAKKLRDDFALPLVEYTRPVLLNTLRPNSARHSQLASNLLIEPLLRRPSLTFGFALPMMPSSSPVGASVSPLVQPTLPDLQAKTC